MFASFQVKDGKVQCGDSWSIEVALASKDQLEALREEELWRSDAWKSEYEILRPGFEVLLIFVSGCSKRITNPRNMLCSLIRVVTARAALAPLRIKQLHDLQFVDGIRDRGKVPIHKFASLCLDFTSKWLPMMCLMFEDTVKNAGTEVMAAAKLATVLATFT